MNKSVKPVVYTAQSKAFFYCRDAVCEFVFNQGYIPINPFRVFDYFLGDRVSRDCVREGNNNIIRVCDEVWVFGHVIANGVLSEIKLAIELKKPLRYFSIDNRARLIREIRPSMLRFERELYSEKGMNKKELHDYMFAETSSEDGDLDTQQLTMVELFESVK